MDRRDYAIRISGGLVLFRNAAKEAAGKAIITAEDIRRTIEHLPMLCTRGAAVIWTRGASDPDIRPAIRGWFAGHGFEEEFFLAEPDSFGVGVHRFTGEPQPLDPAVKLFTFVR